MNITICEIGKEQSRLRREIMERRCVLAALDIMHEHVASGEVVPASTLGDLILNLAPVRQPRDLKEVTESVAAPEPAALPSPPLPSPEEYYVHPELKALGGHGSDTSRVRWAISQMTRDYSLQHLAALLKREGIRLSSAKISVVLSRLKKCGEIEEIRSGAGPIPTLFRRPNIPRPADFKPLDEDLELPPEPYRALRQLISTNPRFERLTPQTSLSDS